MGPGLIAVGDVEGAWECCEDVREVQSDGSGPEAHFDHCQWQGAAMGDNTRDWWDGSWLEDSVFTKSMASSEFAFAGVGN